MHNSRASVVLTHRTRAVEQDLASAAQSGASLATPGFGYSQISPSTYSSTMASLLGQRANTAAVAPAYGASGVNSAEKDVQSAYGNATSNVPDPNYGHRTRSAVVEYTQDSYRQGRCCLRTR
jgi:hypothetical protein